LIEHFCAKAQVSIEYTTQQKDMWSEFIDFFDLYSQTKQFLPDEEYDVIEEEQEKQMN